ncbi:DUF3263 domain-containing protein [Gordonia sp. NPDC003424]
MASPQSADPEILRYASRWHLYGGGPAREIRERFGLSEREFFTRLSSALDANPDGVSSRRVARMRAVAARRLWLCS